MPIPLKYNLRNLYVRKSSTLATVGGVSLVTAVFIVLMALANGLQSSLVTTGEEMNLVVMRKGPLSETSSFLPYEVFQAMRALAGIAQDEEKRPLIVGELLIIYLHQKQGGGEGNVILRGGGPLSFQLRPQVRLVEGRRFRPGLPEVIVSRRMRDRFAHLEIGEFIQPHKKRYQIVGIFDAGNTAQDSEVWADHDVLAEDFHRRGHSSVLLRATDRTALTTLKEAIENDPRIHLQAIPEREYYREQTHTPLISGVYAFGFFISILLAFGAFFGALNTMYATVSARVREIGTLRALGFSRRAILSSFVLESVLTALVGWALGVLLALPVHNLSTGTTNWTTVSELAFSFRISPGIVLLAILWALLIGVAGAICRRPGPPVGRSPTPSAWPDEGKMRAGYPNWVRNDMI
ncbi:MAG: ABC transporter permease [Candidatus Tectomicrobia bacterium]|uniref:ABC transporter permease n=1 Tax=Tectimicrobiota bacterium TaxID=2528274 RepID=A0A932G1J1_UNCTE|nr:ABC transporter permease [Candidatus Tectomicrobia bacterium]